MGVTGLWKLIEPCGKPVPVETLEGKILAVDISIWLHQVVKGFQDNKGSALNNAHLLGLFHRLCKLLYYRVRPVFIFDGCVPQLKRDTIARRQQQRNKLSNEADRIQALLLQSLAKEKVVQQALGTNAELLLKSPIKRPTKATRGENAMDELFKLPEVPVAEGAHSQDCESESSYNSDDYTSTSATDSSYDDSNARSTYNNNLQAIDVKSQHFRNLPADVRHDILTDIKETRKQSSWGRLHELPSHSDEFSTFQMKRLLKRRAVQESLEAAEQEMGGNSLTYSQLSNFFNEEGIITPSAIADGTKQISSDENTRYLLVRDLKKILSKPEPKVNNCATTIKEEKVNEEVVAVKKTLLETQPIAEEDEQQCEEYDADLELAIALSMEQTQVYKEQDYEYDADQDLKLNRLQSKQLRNAAKGPARAYMIEYAGMNDSEVNNIMDVTQPGDANNISYLDRLLNITTKATTEEQQNESKELAAPLALVVSDDDDDIQPHTAKNSCEQSTVEDEKPTSTSRLKLRTKDDATAISMHKATSNEVLETTGVCDSALQLEKQKLNLHVSDVSDTDSDFEEVTNELSAQSASAKRELQIVLNVEEPIAMQDDIFADVFETSDSQTNFKQQPGEVMTAIKNIPQVLENVEIIEIKDSQEELLKSDIINNSNIKSTHDNSKMLSILDELKKQTAEVKNIKLEAIKISNSQIEIADDAVIKSSVNLTQAIEAKIKTEIIEIYDSDDNQKKITKSPKQQTPSKCKAITEYFDTAYHIKRTPDKPRELSPTPPKVKSPFFVNKTPKSGRKRTPQTNVDDDESNDGKSAPANKSSKVSKMLFQNSVTDDTDVVPIAESQPAKVCVEELIQEAADALKSQKTAEELDNMAKQLAVERRDLETERNRQDRMGMSISQRMNADCQELLRLFGVPFIVAPMEAEAQCAFLNAVELTNGTITDDSDIWLFGGRTVYKNFFAQNKHVLEFRAEQIEKSFNCDRKKLIQLACLVGSDYTTGVHGIGAVTALEILASFGSVFGQDTSAKCDERELTSNSIQNVIATLNKFRDWWLAHKSAATPPGSSARLSLRKKLKNIELHEGFPSVAVIEAYLTPKIDDNKDSFSWGVPDVESLREFARKTFGWTTLKTDDILLPVMKKINEKKTQGSLLNYFAVKSALSVRQLQVSKRVQTAIDKMSGRLDAETPEKPVKSTRTKRTKRAAASTSTSSEGNAKETAAPTVTTEPESATTSKPAKSQRLSLAKEVIPQRKINLARLAKNKEKAAEVFKKSKACAKKGKE